MIQTMAQNNPAMQQVLPLIQGKSAAQLEQTARNMAKQKGIDIDALASQIGGMIGQK